MDKIIAFILYFVVVLAIGIYFFFKSKGGNEKEYFLGGRHMGPFVTAMSAQASDMSGWLLMESPAALEKRRSLVATKIQLAAVPNAKPIPIQTCPIPNAKSEPGKPIKSQPLMSDACALIAVTKGPM